MLKPHEQRRQKDAWHRFVHQTQFNRFVTFIFNQDNTSVEAGCRMLGIFGTRINRKLHGRNYNKLPNERRTYFIAVPEHRESNLHFHAALWTPDTDQFDAIAKGVYRHVIRSGQINYECKVFTENDRKTIAAYITKCTAKDDTFGDIYLFSNKRKLMPS